jgi:4-diphosphocytidyl-2-C-methyl-D-erythritol kinase
MKIEVSEQGSFYRVWAPAKLNLFFEILGKRPDGYHEIATLATPISIYDRLECRVVESGVAEITLECYDESGNFRNDIPTDESNTVIKAFRVYMEELRKNHSCSREVGLDVKIYKKISSQAGLGGGSSDAAAMLLSLEKLNGNLFSKEKLSELASRVGSDVPLFLEEGASVGRGRGELIEPFALPELWTVVVKPQIGFSTAEVYRRYSSTAHMTTRSIDDALRAIQSYRGDDFATFISKLLFNRLEDVAAEFWKGVAFWKSTLSALPGVLAAQMTGSGSAFFALCPDESTARQVASSARALNAGRRQIEDVFVAKTLSQG